MINRIKKNKAITLIALVITVVILIILAAVAINLSIGENGIIARAKQAAELSKYQTAKEAIMIKLNEIKLKCKEEGKDCTIIDIMLGFEDENVTDIFVDKYLYNDEAAIRPGSEVYKNSDKISRNKLKAIVVSHQVAEEYKFCIDGDGEIQGVTKEKNVDALTEESFDNIDIFEDTVIKKSTENNNMTEYTITYNLDGGTYDGQLKTKYTKDDVFTLPTNITVANGSKTFIGWKETEDGTPQIEVIISNQTGNKTFIACWKYNTSGITITTIPNSRSWEIERRIKYVNENNIETTVTLEEKDEDVTFKAIPGTEFVIYGAYGTNTLWNTQDETVNGLTKKEIKGYNSVFFTVPSTDGSFSIWHSSAGTAGGRFESIERAEGGMNGVNIKYEGQTVDKVAPVDIFYNGSQQCTLRYMNEKGEYVTADKEGIVLAAVGSKFYLVEMEPYNTGYWFAQEGYTAVNMGFNCPNDGTGPQEVYFIVPDRYINRTLSWNSRGHMFYFGHDESITILCD